MDAQIKKNFSFAIIAQGVSLIVSVVTNLILPKVLGPKDFSYWQLFIFYATYVPCLALGINDGVYLRYGGETRKTLDVDSVKNQYIVGMIYQAIIAIAVFFVATLFTHDVNRKIVIFLVMIYFLIYTAHNYLGYIFQAINETDLYSKSIIINKAFYLAIQIILLVIGYVNIFIFIPFYIVAFVLALLYLLVLARPLFSTVRLDIRLGISEAKISISTGISLMISNICAMLVVGVGRQVVDMRWGLSAFGKVSFSLTLINFVLTFISQVSMVLFPALRRLQNDELKVFYKKISIGLFLLLPWIYVLYIPGRAILAIWLPEYRESIIYLGIILPICFFDSKMNLISNTFYKVLSKQVTLLKVNICTIVITSAWSLLSAYVFNNVTYVIIGIVFSIIFRSVISDIILNKYIGASTHFYQALDIVLAIIFMLTSNRLKWYFALAIYIISAFIRFYLCRKNVSIKNRRLKVIV